MQWIRFLVQSYMLVSYYWRNLGSRNWKWCHKPNITIPCTVVSLSSLQLVLVSIQVGWVLVIINDVSYISLLSNYYDPHILCFCCAVHLRPIVLSSLTHYLASIFGLHLVLVSSRSDLVKVVLTTSLLGNRPGTYPEGNGTTRCQRRHATCGPIAQIDERRCFQWNSGVLKTD